MGKLKNWFSNISELVKNTYQRFPITVIIIYAITIMFCIGTDFFIPDNAVEHILMIGGVGCLGVFFVETYFKNKPQKIIGVIFSFVISVLFDIIFENATASEDFLLRLFIAYISIMPLLTLYKIIKDSELEFKQYFINLFTNICKSSIIYAVLNIGIAIVLSIFIVLILDGEHWAILTRTLGLILGLYYIPAILNSFSDMTVSVGKFIKGLIVYVFTPIVTFLIAILYLYLLKIIINGELLHNSIFFILSLTFVMAIPTVLLLKNYDDKRFIKILSNIITYSYVPFIFLQIYSMGIRVSEYGLTQSRYMAYMLIILEIVFLILLIVKKSKYLNCSILVLALLVFLGTVTPLNVMDVSYGNQANRIEKMLSEANGFDNLTEEEKDLCTSIYRYLKIDNELDRINISSEELEKIKNYYEQSNDYTYYSEQFDSIRENCDLDGLDISQYSKIYELDSEYIDEEELDKENMLQYELESENGDIKVSANLEEYAEQLIYFNKNNYYHEEDSYLETNLLKTNQENIDIYITSIYIRYNVDDYKMDNLNISGYILEK